MAFKIDIDTPIYLMATYGVGNPKTQHGFLYKKEGSIRLHYCKELVCFNAQPADQILFKLKINDDLDRILKTFKKLDKWYGFDTPVEIIQHQDGPILSITGDHWYFSHKIAFEVLAIMLKESYDNDFKNLDDFVYGTRYLVGVPEKVKNQLVKILKNPVGILKAAEKHKYDFGPMRSLMSHHFSYGLVSCLCNDKLKGLTELPLD